MLLSCSSLISLIISCEPALSCTGGGGGSRARDPLLLARGSFPWRGATFNGMLKMAISEWLLVSQKCLRGALQVPLGALQTQARGSSCTW